MLHKIDNFENKTPSEIKSEKIILSCGDEIKVYTIETIHDLVQFIGFGKYINNHGHNVYLRGQTSLYNGSLIPSIYRNRDKYDSITAKFNKKINSAITSCKSFKKYDRKILDPLLQHYGIKTNQIDVVDNIWVALWFALHETKCETINSHEYVYYYDTTKEFCYILLLASDAVIMSPTHMGVYEGNTTRLVDLRKALPSYFLRPHSQHAYMLKKLDYAPADYSDLIIGIAKIPTRLAFKWIGSNDLLTVNSLFPAAYFDSGYKVLLKEYPEYDISEVRSFGSIQIITD